MSFATVASTVPMNTVPTSRVRRKPVPKFDFASMYPEPDPFDPLAPLSVLRSRHPDTTSSSSSARIPIVGRKSFDDAQWPRHTAEVGKSSIQERDGSEPARGIEFPSRRPNMHHTTHSDLGPSTARGRTERRRRSQSGGASSLHSINDPPPLPRRSGLRQTPAPSPAPSSSSKRRTDLPQPNNRASVAPQLIDFSDYPLHLIHTVGRDAGSSKEDRRASLVKPMKLVDVDMPTPAMTRDASVHSVLPPHVRPPLGRQESPGRTVKKKGSGMSIFTYGRRSRSNSSSLAPRTTSRPSTSSADSDSGYMTAASRSGTPSPSSSGLHSRSSSRRSSSIGRGAPIRRKLSTVYAGGTPNVDEWKDPGKLVRQRSLKKSHRKSVSASSLRAKISLPVSQPVPVPFTFGGSDRTVHRMQSESMLSTPRLEAEPVGLASSSQAQILSDVSPISRSALSTMRLSPPSRPARSHLRSSSAPNAAAIAAQLEAAASDVGGQPPSAPSTAATRTAPPPQLPPRLESQARGLSNYKPGTKSPPLAPRAAPTFERPPPPALPKLKVPPLATGVSPVSRSAGPRTAGAIAPSRSFPMSRRRSSSLFCDHDFTSSPLLPTSPGPRALTPSFDHEQKHSTVEENAMPSALQLAAASRMVVLRENGSPVPFGELWKTRRTVVLFVRYFWCPHCQDYLASIMSDVDHSTLQNSGVQLVVIGCGPYNLIKSYRHIFRLPYPVFVDPSPDLQLYRVLGMDTVSQSHAAHFARRDRGKYARHGPVRGLAMVWKNALRTGMPIWTNGGDSSQLGGEFVLGPGLACSFAHRMQHIRGHAPILDVLMAAGVDATHAPRVRVALSRGTDSDDTSGSDSEPAPVFLRPSAAKRNAIRPGDDTLVRAISRGSVEWDSNLSSESSTVFIRAN